jgi:hypothetical protein
MNKHFPNFGPNLGQLLVKVILFLTTIAHLFNDDFFKWKNAEERSGNSSVELCSFKKKFL